MNGSRTLMLLAAALIPALVLAGPQQHIKLIDGSVLRAEVISLDQGIYRLRSGSLGEIQIPAAKIQSISTAAPAIVSATPARLDDARIKGLRETMIRDPGMMAKIESLQNEPEVKDILNDQETMRAIQSGDLDSLMNDPKIKALLENSTVREITQGGL